MKQVPNFERLKEIVQRMADSRVLVAGDLMLDEFIWGKVSRISPEAPVPVVAVSKETVYPGGAANVARNLREFTENATVLGMVGDDANGRRLCGLLEDGGIGTEGVVPRIGVPTTIKTRIIARTQQVVRVDRESLEPARRGEREALMKALDTMLPHANAVILEDYGKGLFDAGLAAEIITHAKSAGCVVTVDPNPNNPIEWRDATVVKPNRFEAFAAAGCPWSDPVADPFSDKALLEVGDRLLEKWNCEQLLITLSELGMLLLTREGGRFHIPTRAREVYDVSGAGDTAIALYTLSLCAGAEPFEAAEIANHASGVVVGKLGTATLSPVELLESFEDVHGS